MTNIICTVHRPDLTAEERKRRMEAIKKAAADLVLATEREKIRKERQKHEQNHD